MHSFTYNGVNSRNYCELYVSGGGTFNAPERDFESIPIPGRNGELTLDNGRFKNITVEYEGWIAKDFLTNSAKARAWLCSQYGYKRLEDDYHPDEYRMARFVSGLEMEPFVSSGDYLAGTTIIKFDCMPQRFLKSGETEIVKTDEMEFTITNPTLFESRPIITVSRVDTSDNNRDFSIIINGNTIQLTDIDSEIILDSELYRAYKIVNNQPVSLDSHMTGEFQPLIPGINTFSITEHRISLSIVPRWWTL